MKTIFGTESFKNRDPLMKIEGLKAMLKIMENNDSEKEDIWFAILESVCKLL